MPMTSYDIHFSMLFLPAKQGLSVVIELNTPFCNILCHTLKEASCKENENKVLRNLIPEFGGKTLAPKFSIGDHVRITKKKKALDKLYTQRWT